MSNERNSDDYSFLTGLAQKLRPQIGVILGSGMSDVVSVLQRQACVKFGDIPGLGFSSVLGHKGQLSLGHWAGKLVLVFEGRLHYYEGHPWRAVVKPVQIAHQLGVRCILLTNAAGGINENLLPGDLMAIRDHVQWNRRYCWQQPGPGGIGGERRNPYSSRLLQILLQAGRELGIELHQGIYASVTGPCYETPAEIRALTALGADAVGMSTAREVAAAHELGIECAAISCITNKAAGLSGAALSHDDVLKTVATQSSRLAKLVESFIRYA